MEGVGFSPAGATMNSTLRSFITASAAAFSIAALAHAQQEPKTAAINANDPRVGLKAGLHDAGVAAKNMELVAHTPKPPGFFDPKNPIGNPIPAERPANEPPAAPETPTPGAPAAAGNGTPPGPPANPNALSFTNSDIAFRGTQMFV